MGNTVRYDYIDIAKCFSMIVIIWGHIMLSGATNAMVYGFHISMGHETLGKSLVAFFSAAILGIASMLSICIYYTRILDSSRLNMGGAICRWFGRNSFDVMATHNPIKGFVIVVIAKLLHTSTGVVSNSLAYSFVSFVITIAITMAMVWIITVIKKKYREVSIKN